MKYIKIVFGIICYLRNCKIIDINLNNCRRRKKCENFMMMIIVILIEYKYILIRKVCLSFGILIFIRLG